MFSITTMASSTTNPVEIVSAISDRLSIEYPSRYITPHVPTKETGTAIAGIAVDQTFLRKTKITRITSTTVINSVIWMSFTAARIETVRSDAITISAAA